MHTQMLKISDVRVAKCFYKNVESQPKISREILKLFQKSLFRNRLPVHKVYTKCGERSNQRKNIIDKLGRVFRQSFRMVSKNFIKNPHPRIVRELLMWLSAQLKNNGSLISKIRNYKKQQLKKLSVNCRVKFNGRKTQFCFLFLISFSRKFYRVFKNKVPWKTRKHYLHNCIWVQGVQIKQNLQRSLVSKLVGSL